VRHRLGGYAVGVRPVVCEYPDRDSISLEYGLNRKRSAAALDPGRVTDQDGHAQPLKAGEAAGRTGGSRTAVGLGQPSSAPKASHQAGAEVVRTRWALTNIAAEVSSVSGFLCDPQRLGHPAGTAALVVDRGGVHVAVEAAAEDGPADPVGLTWAGGGNRVRHLENLAGLQGVRPAGR
jgi:hypothetical protein